MTPAIRQWLSDELAATFDLAADEVDAIVDESLTGSPLMISPLARAHHAAEMVAFCRVVRSVPGAREILAEHGEPHLLGDFRFYGKVWDTFHERYAPPAPDALDPNWPDYKMRKIILPPDGAVPDDEFMLGDGQGNRYLLTVVAGQDRLEARRRHAYSSPFSAWEDQAWIEAEAILRREIGADEVRAAIQQYDAPRGPVRRARPDDVPAILSLIRELATYERSPESVVATEDGLRSALFGKSPAVFCHVAEAGGEVVGFALWFLNFSTWLGRHGLYLEDLFVRPSHRGSGLGKALLEALVGIARERGYGRVEWVVLDWNSPAQDFYRAMGAEPLDDWTVWRLEP